MSNNLHRRISFGLFEFDVDSGELRRDGAVVKLAPQPARVLGLLVSRPGDVVLRGELRRELWGDETFVDFERGLNFCITQARAALGDSSDNPRFIQTVPRRGYRFIAPVAVSAGSGWGSEVGLDRRLRPPTPPPRPPTPSAGWTPLTLPAPGRAVSRWRGRPLIGTAAIAIVATLLWWVWGVRPSSSVADSISTNPVRLVVLPFANLTGDARTEDIAAGLTDELITQLGLAAHAQVAVIARTSAMAYRGTNKSIAEIARELNVRYLIEGSLRREGEALRISGGLIDAATQTAVLPLEELLDAGGGTLATQQTHTSIRIARRVAAHLLPTAGDRAEPPATANAGAWDAYMQASASIHRGTPDDIRRAVQQLENAVQHDASFGAAWARLAEAHHMLVMMGVVAPRDAYPAARTAARRALTTAPNLPAAHLASGLIHLWYDWNPDAAAAAFQRALASNPSLAAAHHDYAWALVALGRPADAIQHMTRARDLDPISTRANNDVGWLYLFVRQPEQAARACQHTLAIDHHSLEAQACLERSYAQRQLFEAALQAARATLPVTEDVPPGAPGAAGLREIWTLRLRQLERAAETRWINPYTIAVHHALTGAPDRALAALEDAYRQRVGMLVFLARDPAMDSLRGNPHFDALVRRISATAP